MFTLLRGYQGAWLRGDLIAGVTVAAIAIPESLGYASIAGLPVQTGLYCALLPAVVFALLASSRQLVVGADSATAALVAAGAGAVAAAGSTQYVDAVAVLCLIVGVFLLVMALAKLGFLADLISQPVLTGFLAGVGVSLIIGKLPDVLGIKASGTTWDKLVDTVQGLGDINATSALLGLGVVVTMVGGAKVAPKVPAALVALVLFSLIAYLIDAEAKGVGMVGALPSGLPSFAFPSIDASEIARLSATAASIAVVVLAQSAAVARSFATKNGYKVEENADLYGLSLANAASAVTGGFAINGSPPRTAAGDGSGSRSQLVNIVMAVVIGLLLLFAAGVFAYVPSAVLDAIVLAIGIHLIKVGELKRIAQTRRAEFVTALLALVVVAFVGVEQGVLLAVVVSLVDRVRRQYHPPDEVLVLNGEVEPRLRSRISVPDEVLRGVVLYRFGTSLFFANANYFDERARDLLAKSEQPVRALIVDCAAMEDIDFTGAGVLRRLAEELKAHDGLVVLTELSAGALESAQQAGLDDVVTIVPRIEDVTEVVAARRAAGGGATDG